MSSTSWETPRAAFRSVSACSKRCPSTPSTTSPYIWMSRRYESSAKRGLPVDAARPSTATSFRPRLRIVSIIPGIETAAPERTETSSGLPSSPKPLPVRSLERRDVLVDLVVEARGDLTSAREVRATGLGRDREPVRDGDAELRHLGEADPLPAEELTTAARVLAEVEDVAHLRGESTRTRQRAETRMVTWSSLSWMSLNACWCATGVTRRSSPALRTVSDRNRRYPSAQRSYRRSQLLGVDRSTKRTASASACATCFGRLPRSTAERAHCLP